MAGGIGGKLTDKAVAHTTHLKVMQRPPKIALKPA